MSKAAVILAAGPGAFFRKAGIVPAWLCGGPEKCDKEINGARHD
jgi:hypothetical protein